MTGSRSARFWVFIGLLVLAHFLLHLALGLGRSTPDLLTVALLLGARRLGPVMAATLGLALGLLRDALSLVSFGADAITLTLLGYLGARSRDLFVGDSMLFIALYLFIGKWLHDIVYDLVAGSVARGDTVMRLLVQAPLAALYAAVVGTAAFLAYRAITGERG